MGQRFLREIADQLQHERRILIKEINEANEAFRTMTETRQPERNEEAQQERDWISLGSLEDQQQKQLADIDTALARIEAGTYGTCRQCGRAIDAQSAKRFGRRSSAKSTKVLNLHPILHERERAPARFYNAPGKWHTGCAAVREVCGSF
jgi:DnaK suppressor protein